jgi:hypothetical protein
MAHSARDGPVRGGCRARVRKKGRARGVRAQWAGDEAVPTLLAQK